MNIATCVTNYEVRRIQGTKYYEYSVRIKCLVPKRGPAGDACSRRLISCKIHSFLPLWVLGVLSLFLVCFVLFFWWF